MQEPTVGGKSCRRAVCAPLLSSGQNLGVLVLLRDDEPLNTEEQRVLELVATGAAMALQNARLAATDPLTGLFNRRYFERALSIESQRTQRSGKHLGLITIDIDHFKRFNDDYGHPAGDQVLRSVARTIEQQLRRTDIVARIGGEEFSAILPEQQPRAVRIAAERVRRAVEHSDAVIWEGRRLPPVRVSVGGASAAPRQLDSDELVGYADRALRYAKRHGRNRVHLATASDRTSSPGNVKKV